MHNGVKNACPPSARDPKNRQPIGNDLPINFEPLVHARTSMPPCRTGQNDPTLPMPTPLTSSSFFRQSTYGKRCYQAVQALFGSMAMAVQAPDRQTTSRAGSKKRMMEGVMEKL